MMQLAFCPVVEIQRIRDGVRDAVRQSEILADVFRLNTLSMIMQAGSGHIGSSFSCMDIITWLWLNELTNPNDLSTQHADICFSSKGHDAPALYSLMIGLGLLDEKYLHQLRRLNGLPGHPEVHTPHVITNTGSLGMGISKARGMAMANRLTGKTGRIYVITGDGELQEGQFWESLQPAANGKFAEITVIVDHNKMQSDTWVKQVSDLGDLETKFRSFGWEVARCDGHDIAAMAKILEGFKQVNDRPQILIADTVKGKGVSVMESSAMALAASEAELPMYKFHSGAPALEHYELGVKELSERVNANLKAEGLEALSLKTVEIPNRIAPNAPQKLVAAYGEELVALAAIHKDIVALDGDLMLDTGLVPFRNTYPERFIECGIAEQDMVSMAGGLAVKGMLPVVHSFACFLSTRPNEQIFNNGTEHTKVIYAGSLAGIAPSMPGHSHQSVRDISALGSIPGLTLIQPADAWEARQSLCWAVEENPQSTYIRLVTVPTEIPYALPADYELKKGCGVTLQEGTDAVLFGYGPTMLTEAYKAVQLLLEQGVTLSVINLPWLNFVDAEWLQQATSAYGMIFTLDDHYLAFGQGMLIRSQLAGTSKNVVSLGLETVPACGQNQEVLKHHGLDAESIAATVASNVMRRQSAPVHAR